MSVKPSVNPAPAVQKKLEKLEKRAKITEALAALESQLPVSSRKPALGPPEPGAAADDDTEASEKATPLAASGLSHGMHILAEFVACVVVGSFLGFWFDRWLGSAPWGLIAFFFLGVAAGFWTLVKASSGPARGPDRGLDRGLANFSETRYRHQREGGTMGDSPKTRKSTEDEETQRRDV